VEREPRRVGGRERAEYRHLIDPWPRRSPLHGAQVAGVPVMVKLDGRELQVQRILATYAVRELGGRVRGTAWKLQLEDYRRVVVLHEDDTRWLLAQ
jgi:hypothetical protein